MLLLIKLMKALVHAVGESLELLELIDDILRSHDFD